MDRLPDWKGLDISVKAGIGLLTFTTGCAAIVLPNKREREAMALQLYDAPVAELKPQQRRVAEFAAGHKRWADFFQTRVYPLTRKLPGSKSPILNPYRDMEPLAGGGGDEDDGGM